MHQTFLLLAVTLANSSIGAQDLWFATCNGVWSNATHQYCELFHTKKILIECAVLNANRALPKAVDVSFYFLQRFFIYKKKICL